jgi:ParB family transcriptional regulator, chromosome partitioning protein
MSAKEVNPRLGRGLAALLGDAAGSERSPQSAGTRQIPVEHLEPSPFQPRNAMDPAALKDLSDSIKARGILQPLLARPHPTQPGRYQIIAGERRWRASQDAGLHEVPVLIRDLNDAETMAAALVENLQRQDLNAIEEAEGYKRLFDEFGMTQEVLAESVGKSRPHIANTLRLLNLPLSVRNEVRKGVLTPGHARALLAHPEPEKAALAVIAKGLNVRQTEALSSRKTQQCSEGGIKPARDPETEALERDLTARLGLKVEVNFDGKGGSIKISYRSLDQLDGIVSLLSR